MASRPISERFYNTLINSPASINSWLQNFEKKYCNQKDNLTPKMKADITELYNTLSEFQEENGGVPSFMLETLENSTWVIAAATALREKNKTKRDEAFAKLNMVEKATFENLRDTIWNFEGRKFLASTFYDYDEDDYMSFQMEIPRKFDNKEEETDYSVSFETSLANIIYNRGSLIIRVSKPRNNSDIYGIYFTERGEWEAVPAKELKEIYASTDDDAEYTGPRFEHYKELPGGHKPASAHKDILQFPGNKLKDTSDFDFKPAPTRDTSDNS